MTVYSASAVSATPRAMPVRLVCPVESCRCWSRPRSYPSDLTDEQWRLLEPILLEQMAALVKATGRPMHHSLRAMLDAVFYTARNGIEWRALPVDFPPWQAVYAFYQRWNARGLPEALSHRLRDRLRSTQDRPITPSLGIIDSQTVKAADTVAATSRGYDGGKKINGRKRHLIVDVNGWLLAVIVTAANINDRLGLRHLLITLLNTGIWLKTLLADTGYDGWAPRWFCYSNGNELTLKATPRRRGPSFTIYPRRWIVERTFAWLMRYRRLARDYERRPEHHQALIWWANTHLITRHLTKRHQPTPRWKPRKPQPTPT